MIKRLFRPRNSPQAEVHFGLDIPPPPATAKVMADRLVGPVLSPADLATLDTTLTYVVAQLDQALHAMSIVETTFNVLGRAAARDRLKRVMIEISAVREGPVMAVARSGLPPLTAMILRQRAEQDDQQAAKEVS